MVEFEARIPPAAEAAAGYAAVTARLKSCPSRDLPNQSSVEIPDGASPVSTGVSHVAADHGLHLMLMALRVSQLRRWFALGAILMIATVSGMYFYARWRVGKVVHDVPAKMGLEIQQTAEGFSISKSVEGRTQFKVSASKAVQLKEGGRAQLHNVKIVIYGKDASRFDRIAGDDFEYDPVSGDINAKGRVLIDLEANPEGIHHSDQSPPEQVRAPLHLESDGLAFNKNTGDASSTGKVIFQTPQASGSAVGIQYVAKTGTMNLLSAVVMTVNRAQPVHLDADRGVITKQPHQVVLTTVHMSREQQEAWSEQATFFLREDNTVDRVLAEGDVRTEIHGSAETHERSDRAEMWLTGSRNLLTLAILTGNVQLRNQAAQSQSTQNEGAQNQGMQNPTKQAQGGQPFDAAAERVTLHFAGSAAGEQLLKTVHAEDGVRLTQKNSPERSPELRWHRQGQSSVFILILTCAFSGEGRRANSRHRDDRSGDGLHRERRSPAGACPDQRTAANRDHAAGRESEDSGYRR